MGGDTSFETKSMLFGAMLYPAKKRLELKFHPIMQSSKVFIESVDKVTNSRNPVEISLEDDHNPGDIFASVLDAVVDFSGGSDSSGGFLTPNMPINAISKVQGAIGGVLEDLKELKFSPASVFGGVDDRSHSGGSRENRPSRGRGKRQLAIRSPVPERGRHGPFLQYHHHL